LDCYGFSVYLHGNLQSVKIKKIGTTNIDLPPSSITMFDVPGIKSPPVPKCITVLGSAYPKLQCLIDLCTSLCRKVSVHPLRIFPSVHMGLLLFFQFKMVTYNPHYVGS
jgi:hypothetical protein